MIFYVFIYLNNQQQKIQHCSIMVFLLQQMLSTGNLPYLPTEIWIKIFKEEHRIKLNEIHKQIKENTIIKQFREILDITDWDDINYNWTNDDIIDFASQDSNTEEDDIVYYLEMNAYF